MKVQGNFAYFPIQLKYKLWLLIRTDTLKDN